MQVKSLQWKRVTRMTLLVLMLSIIGTMNANIYSDEDQNDDWGRPIAYDFYKTCPSGLKLYYKITNSSLHYVSLSSLYGGSEPYGLNPPTGNLTIPETVTNDEMPGGDGLTYTVTAIADHAFHNCHGLTGQLVIPNTVTSIGFAAFSFCEGFTGLTLSESLVQIGGNAFEYCENLQGDLVIPNGVTSIQEQVFHGCTHFTGTLTLPNSLTSIGTSAFAGCGFTGPLVLPNTLKNIYDYAFENCSGFTGDIIIPSSVAILRAGVFKNCTGFHGDLVISGSFPKLFEETFSGLNIRAIYLNRVTPPNLQSGISIDNIFSGSLSKPFYVPVPSNYSNWTYFTNKQQRYFFAGSSNANWSDANNWSPSFGNDVVIVADCEMNSSSANVNSLTIISRYNISIKPGSTLTVNNAINNYGTAANLIIEDGGQLMHQQNGVLATVKKNISAYSSDNNGWHLISSSLASNSNVTSVENLLSNTYDLFYYDEPTAYWMNQMDPTNNFTELVPGRGYLYANSENVTLEFAGALRKGTETFTISPLSYEGELLKGFNLIGNPYAHNVTSLTTTDVAQGCYRMNGTLDDLMVSEVSSANPLKPAEGIFVLATSENASVTFNSNATFKTRTETVNTGSICVEVLENGKITDRLLVKRNEGSDFQKLSLTDNRTKLFATRDTEELAIVVSNDDEQAVNFKTAKNGTYTISVTLQDVEVDYLHLIDNLTGNNVDLLANPTYTFEARTTDYTSRFRLVFSPEAIENGNSESFAFVANGEFVIANEGMATLQVIDLTGRILSTETINGSFSMPINLSSGVYMLRLINGNDVKTQKIVVE